MRVNVYAEEITDQIEIVEKKTKDGAFTGIRFYLNLPVTIPQGAHVANAHVTGLHFHTEADGRTHVSGPFLHHEGDDDSAAVTFWGKKGLKEVLKKALELLESHG